MHPGAAVAAQPPHARGRRQRQPRETQGAAQVADPRAFDGRDVPTARPGFVGVQTAPNQEDPHGRHGRQAEGRHHDPPIHDRDSRGGSRRPACTHRGDALADQGACRRSLAGRAARDDAGARPLLDDRVRLAQVRGATERAAAVHDRDRWRGHPLHPRALAARGRAAADHDARLARLGRRAARDRRPAHRPDGARRRRRGRLPPGLAVDTRLRLLG